ncbi:Pr6Pr family membrane protein [Dactylosporangium sp. NPDC048998]|uniref:Pr6Pr family membrane protein n=1 Tax=Dactylosporangium sp. NPDC048998 TaxID=3363976 RepID=UPI00371E62A6
MGLALSVLFAPTPELLLFFTIQVDLLYLAVVALRAGDGIRTATTAYIASTAVVFVLVLANPWSGYQMVDTTAARGPVSDVANLLLHVAVPVFVVIDWFRNRPARPLPRWASLLWLAYPLAYLAVVLARATWWSTAADRYLYPFLDVPTIGYGQVAVNAAVFALLLVALGGGAAGVARRSASAATPSSRAHRCIHYCSAGHCRCRAGSC